MFTPQEFNVVEGGTVRIAGVITEEDGVTPIPGSLLTSLTIQVYDQDLDQTDIVTPVSILNENHGTVDEDGNLIVLLTDAQNPIRNQDLPFERHTVLFRWTWGTDPLRHGFFEVILVVRNLAKVP